MNTENRTIKNILLVEDDLRDVELTLAALAGNNLSNKVFVVHDGSEALDYLYHRGKFSVRAPGNPTALLGLMTAAFAIGQLAGPVVAGTLELLPIAPTTALGYALQFAAFALALSAGYLWRHSHRSSSN